MMAKARHAGGYVDRGDGQGWVLDDSPPQPEPAEAPPVTHPVRREPFQAGGWTFNPEPEPASPEPEPVTEPVETLSGTGQHDAQPTTADVRAWAREQGIDVPSRGRVPAEVLDRYLAAEAGEE